MLRTYRNDLKNLNDFYTFFSDKMLTESYPKVDVYSDENNYFVEADFPGFNKDEINIEFEENKLNISAKKSNQKEDKSLNFHRRERSSYEYNRDIFFKDVDDEKISASLENGVLRVTLPKKKDIINRKKVEIK